MELKAAMFIGVLMAFNIAVRVAEHYRLKELKERLEKEKTPRKVVDVGRPFLHTENRGIPPSTRLPPPPPPRPPK